MTLFYVLIMTFVLLVAYAGYDATMGLIHLIDLQIRYAWIRVQMKWMERNLKRKLLEDIANYQQILKEHQEHDL